MSAVGVTLNDWELDVCDMTAKQRTNHWTIHQQTYDENLYGCKGEMATAKALNLYWSGFDTRIESDRQGDVGEYQVKSTVHKDGHLIFQQTHKMGQKTVLAIVGINKVRLAGWLHFDNAKRIVADGVGRKEWRGEGYDYWTWWIPQHALEGMDWLPIVCGPEVVKL